MIHLINHPDAQTVKIREGRKGFWMVFRNDWGISVQWSDANYCDGYMTQDGGTGKDAEIVILLPEDRAKEHCLPHCLPVPSGGLLCDPSGMTEVWGHLNEQEVLRAMTIVSGFADEMDNDDAYRTFVRDMAFGKEITA